MEAMTTRPDETKHADVPPTRTMKPMDAPPHSSNPTSAQLKGDIDSGRTGDKVEVFDPGLSPLGTDDEAAGHPPSAERVKIAREHEGKARWQGGADKAGHAHQGPSHKALFGYVGFIAAVLVVFVAAFSMF
jgi:hypothetical protein